ncbi:hypothetical protein SAY86_003943 [Trapa natans]|uniref:Uncharacterized protein n=1 Tax=Trapa natans TaxID=22666 RepID=A0AAN7N2S9_TRANT|nr:hypothetical protein SAY86_003943 [Trapa natans]
MDKYRTAAREILIPEIGYVLADELRRAGFWVQTSQSLLYDGLEVGETADVALLDAVGNSDDFIQLLVDTAEDLRMEKHLRHTPLDGRGRGICAANNYILFIIYAKKKRFTMKGLDLIIADESLVVILRVLLLHKELQEVPFSQLQSDLVIPLLPPV